MTQQTAMEFHLREMLMLAHHQGSLGAASSAHKLDQLKLEERTQKFLADYGAIPTRLNGWPVMAVLPIQHKTPREHAEYAVLVERPQHPAHRFVVAVWRKPFGDSWDCGEYTDNLSNALVMLIHRAKIDTKEG